MIALNLIPVHVYGMVSTWGTIWYCPGLISFSDRNIRTDNQRLLHARMARSSARRDVPKNGTARSVAHKPHHSKGIEADLLQGHGLVTSKLCRVIKANAGDELIDVKKDGQEIGEMVFSGNICAKGYYKDPEATAKLHRGGVLHTEDLAVWHPDGSVQILDRAKDIIISGEQSTPRFTSSVAG